MRLRALVLSICVVAFGSAALAQESSQPSVRATARIQKEVRHELVMLPYLGVFDNLAYRVDGDKVTLMGQVTRPTLKTDAERVVKGIEGVEQVDNQIEVLPASPMDDQLRIQLYHAIYGYAPLEKYAMGVQRQIRIVVKNGHVTLEGVVDSDNDKNLVNIPVAGTDADGQCGNHRYRPHSAHAGRENVCL